MSKSSVGREVELNKDSDGVYRGSSAHRKYLDRRRSAKTSSRKIGNDLELQKYIVQKLKRFWSPEQIAGRLKLIHGQTKICHETIYTFVYTKRKDLIKYLRHQKSKYRKKRGSRVRMSLARAMKVRRFEERPVVVHERSRLGDWENDTVVGKEKKQRILTNVERKSGYGLGWKLDTVTAEIVNEAMVKIFRKIPKEKRLTLTRDNGTEFGDYDQTLEEKTNMEVYRANPYHSWERGTNENWNGLLRQFFPKGTYFATITQYEIDQAVDLLNDRPRKRLGYRTPGEEFRGSCVSS
jgi:IS30 family transposase